MTGQEKLDQLPLRPGVYLMKDAAGGILYVGKAISLRRRVRSYFQPSADHPPRIASLVTQIRDLDYIIAESETEALVLEFNLIQKHKPRFNVRYRDDKSYPYIRIDLRDDFPRCASCGGSSRRRALLRSLSLGLGDVGDHPPHAPGVQDLPASHLRQGTRWVRLEARAGQRPRALPELPSGPVPRTVPGAVTSEEYEQAVLQVVDFLSGKHQTVVERLEAEMEKAPRNRSITASGAPP